MADNPGVFSRLGDRISEATWFQPIKAKWDEQDQRNKTLLQFGSLGAVALVLTVFVFSGFFTVRGKREELDEKLGLVHRIQGAQEELRRLRAITAGPGLSGGGEWTPYFQGQANEAGLGADRVTVTEKKAPAAKGASAAAPEETLVSIELKKVNVKQLVKYVYQVENGPRTAKVRSLQVDTQPDESGYLDVKMAVSGFTVTKAQ